MDGSAIFGRADAEEVSDDERFAHLRAEPRDSMFLLATMRRGGGQPAPIKVRNLSSGGLMAECEPGVTRGETVEIELRGIGPIEAVIAWVAAGRIGVSFASPVDPKLARKPVTGNPQPNLVKTSRTMWRPGLR